MPRVHVHMLSLADYFYSYDVLSESNEVNLVDVHILDVSLTLNLDTGDNIITRKSKKINIILKSIILFQQKNYNTNILN